MRRLWEEDHPGNTWLTIELDVDEFNILRAAHENVKERGMGLTPTHPMTPLYNFLEELIYGDEADLIATEITAPDI